MKGAEKIVVMGGSFNPPTIAHYKLMKDAMQVVKADLGYFVPVSDAYLKRKMRYNKSAIVLSPKVRIDMLQCMCADGTMKVSDIEMGTVKARSLETLMAIQSEYPTAQIYFIMGDDKMKLLLHLCKNRDSLETFKVILYSRNEVSLIGSLNGVNIPSDYLDNIILCPQPEGISGVSSSLIRERLMSGESCDDLLYPGVVELLKDSDAFNRNVNNNDIQKDMKYSVESIKQMLSADPNVRFIYFWGHTPSVKGITQSCMSQWYDVEFQVAGVKYHTAEQYMMAQKALLFDDKQVFDQIMLADNPRDYKALGRKIRKFDSKIWDARKYDIVVEGNKAKFSQNDDLKKYLLSTGDAILVEASPYDRIWGIGLYPGQAAKGSIDQWRGLNLLGAALMEVRDWLREAR